MVLDHEAPPEERVSNVTSIAQTQRKTSVSAPFIAAIALAAAVLGGVIGTAVQTAVDGAGAQAQVLTVRDLLVLKQAQEWKPAIGRCTRTPADRHRHASSSEVTMTTTYAPTSVPSPIWPPSNSANRRPGRAATTT